MKRDGIDQEPVLKLINEYSNILLEINENCVILQQEVDKQ
jgi:hypothetical protein